MNSGEEIPSELIVSGSDAPEVLEPAEAALNDISAFVGTFVEAMDDDTVGFVGNYRFSAATNDFGAKSVAIIALVGDERAWVEQAPEHQAQQRYRHPGRQSGSLSAWIFVVRPPRERPIA